MTPTEIKRKFGKYSRIIEKIYNAGIEKIFEKYLLSDEAVENFLRSEAKKIDFEKIKLHRNTLFSFESATKLCSHVENPPSEAPQYDELGKESLKKGLWCVITLSGGSATRFFAEEKMNMRVKGLFPITKNHSFLEIFAGEIMSKAFIYGKIPIWVILVSEITQGEIESFIRNFWFPSNSVIILKQGHLPRLDPEGIPIVSKDGSIVWTGDGHGGVFFALIRKSSSGKNYKQILKSLGIRFAVLHNVDNVLARPLEEKRLDFHIRKKALFTISCVQRESVNEKVGIPLYLKDKNRISVMEYSFADQKIFSAVKEDGSPYFNLSHINVNLFSIGIVSSKYLRQLRPVIYTGKIIEIDGKKLESSSIEYLNQGIAETIPAEKVAICLLERSEFFSPTKSMKGENSVDESRKRYLWYIRRKLYKFGVSIPESSYFEIAPYILFGDELIRKIFDFSGWVIEERTEFYFGGFYPAGSYPVFSSCFKLLEGSSFSINSKFPFGDVFSSEDRGICCKNPPRIKVGSGVLIKAGVKFCAELEKDSVLIIPRNCVISEDMRIYVRSGERVSL